MTNITQSLPTRYSAAIGVIRVLAGLTFVLHGWQKLFVHGLGGVSGMMQQLGVPFPELSAALLIATEFGGGLLLLVGLFTRWAAIPATFAMLVAILTAHWGKGFFLSSGGFEYALLLMVIFGSLAAVGGGAFALDNVLWRKREQQIDNVRPIAA